MRAADAAAQAGCELGEELETARPAARGRGARGQRRWREAQAQAEAAREAEATRLSDRSHRRQGGGRDGARRRYGSHPSYRRAFKPRATGARRGRCADPSAVATWRRHAEAIRASSDAEQVRAAVTVYPADAPTSLSQRFVLKTRPVPGTPTLILDQDNQHLTVEQVGLRGQTLILTTSSSQPTSVSTYPEWYNMSDGWLDLNCHTAMY